MGQGWHWMEQHCHSQRWVRLGAASGCNIPEHCLLGRNHLLAASVPTRASHGTLVPSRDCGRMGHDGAGCDSANGSQLESI